MSDMSIRGLTVDCCGQRLIQDIDLDLPAGQLTAIIGPSGGGKTTLLRSLNRLADCSDGLEVNGDVQLAGVDIRSLDVNLLRQRVGMVFQKPIVFPGTIHSNVVFGLRHLGLCDRADEAAIVERELARVGLLDEVCDRLGAQGSTLSVGQQQRLCLARALAVAPEVLLLDEPTSALDPISVTKIEELVLALKGSCTLVLVTHSLSQAKRVADQVVFVSEGQIVEKGSRDEIFADAKVASTQRFLRGEIAGLTSDQAEPQGDLGS